MYSENFPEGVAELAKEGGTVSLVHLDGVFILLVTFPEDGRSVGHGKTVAEAWDDLRDDLK